jgi:glycosyltransferase involved in cell wall biosynthesis
VAAQFAWPEGPASIAAAHSIGVPVTVKARGIDLDRWSRAGDLRLPRLDSADGLLAVSEATKARMAGLGLPPETIAIHRTGLDHSLFYVGDREAAKATLGIRGPLILSAGNLLPNKRHDLAIEAVARLEGFVLIIAGGGPEGEKLKRLAVRLGVQERVKFLGPVPHPDMPNIYRAADATLHTSRREGLSNVWVESIACGTPVIATEADGADETIVEPASGRIVSPDGDAVAAALDWVIAARHDPALVAKAARRFDWSRHGQELEEHFRRVVTAAPSRNAD